MCFLTHPIKLGKQKRSFLVLASLWMAFSPSGAHAAFTNAGFESDSFEGWTIGSWLFGSPLSPYPPTSILGLGLTSASSNGFTNIVSAGKDVNSGNNLSYPLYGSYAAVVNFGGSTYTASSIIQTATMASSDVDPNDNKIHIRFAIAPVLENPAHPPDEQPFFAVEVKDITKGSTLYFQYNYAGQSGVPWLTGESDFQYTNWQAIDIAPGAGNLDVGDSVSIQIVASRCEPGGHHGYVYVDAGNTGTFVPGLLIATLAGSPNAYRGTDLTYTYNYSNTSSASIASVQVAATLPTGTTFVSTTGSGCTTPAVGATGTVTCTLGTLATDAAGSFTITVLVSSSATSPLNNGTYSISGTGAPALLGPLVKTPIPDFTLSGPSGGALNTASTNFSITPNTAYTGTITVTPSGGGLSTPVVLTYSSSSATQTFTVTPTSPGPVTLTPTNNKGSIDPTTLSYATSPAPPAIGTPTAGIGTASVSFTAPALTGGSAITGYTATCNPGAVTGAGTSSPITVSGLTNGTVYTCSVTATNAYGTSAASPASNSVTPGAPASSYTFTGPAGGALNTASSSFTVSPNAAYSGTVTVTPSGGGLSTPVVLTFSSSAVPQTFTVTPSAIGPVTLTPANNGSLPNPSALSYATPPAAPTIGAATTGNASVSVHFTAPGSTGGSAITTYTAACLPGGAMGTGSASPITVSGLTNGTAYTCSVTATNTYGTSAASSASNSVTPAVPASSYTLTGPAGGALNAASSNFTVTPNGPYSGTVTLTPSGGGLSTPVVLTFSSSAAAQTFTITPTAVGPVTVTPTNNGSLTNPSTLTYATPPSAPAIGAATAGNGAASVSFTAPGSTGGSAITTYRATCNPGAVTGTGSTSPITVSGLTNGTAYTCSVTATNTYGTSAASSASNSLTPVAPASSYTFTGPAGGPLNAASSNFIVTPNALYSGTITITPSGGGLSTPVVLTFSSSSTAQTFTIAPTAVGPVSLTPANNGTLTNASALTYATPPSSPGIGTATAGNGSASVSFTAPGSTGGSAISGYTATCNPGAITGTGSASPITVSALTNGTAYTCSVTATNTYGTSAASPASNSVTPVAPASSYTFTGPAGGALNAASSSFTVTPNAAYSGTVTVTPAGGGLSTPVVLTFSNSAAAQTFTISPTAVGPVSLTPANSGTLTNASALTYATPASAPAIGTATAGNGSASVTFTVPGSTGGSVISGYTATCNPGAVTGTGSASPITISGLTNGTAYTCSVTATNTYGTSAASSASNSVTPVAPADSFTLTGPNSGAIGVLSTDFTVTPDSVYTGAITITPAGGGLSVPIVLTFSNSAAAQTFDITPTATGPVTLTPANSGALSNPAALTYATPSDAPVIGTATPENGSASVAFTAPVNDGGSPVIGYTVDCSGYPATGADSPIIVSGLTNGSVYSCTVTATNGVGASAPSAASNAVTPVAPADTFALTGPSGGGAGVLSTAFTVTPDSVYTGVITITPAGGGLSVPIVLTFSNSAAAQTFSITPTATGPVILTAANSGSLANPAALTYATPSDAPIVGTATAGNASATIAFTAPASNGGSLVTGYTVDCGGGNTATGMSSPVTVSGLTNGTVYNCTVTATNGAGTSAPSAASSGVSPVAPADSFTLTGPNSGAIGVVSTDFTVTPDSVYTGVITITPAGGGLSVPIVLTFSNSASAQTFTMTPTAVGPVILTAANSGALSNPAALTYATPSDAPIIGTATAGNASAVIAFTAPANNGGSIITGYTVDCGGGNTATGVSSPITVSGLIDGTAYSCTVTATNGVGTGAASAAANIVTPMGVPDAPLIGSATAGNGSATVSFTGPAGNGSAIVSYVVTSNPGNLTASGTASPITIYGLTNGVSYSFTITAINGVGTGAASAASNLVTPLGVPGAPVIGSAMAGNGSATVSFTAPANNGGSIITGYMVDCGGGHTATGLSSPITVSGLTNGTAYSCTVTATNGMGTGAASAASNVVTPLGVPDAPLIGSATAGNGSATVSFTAPAGNGSIITGYTVDCGGGHTATGLSSPITVSGLTNGTAYSCTVTATNGVGTGAASAASNIVTPLGVPDAPAAVTAIAGNGSATVSFTAPAGNGSAITRYVVTSNPGNLTASGTASPITINGLTNGTAYTFTVSATYAAGAGPASAASNSVTPFAPLAFSAAFPTGIAGLDYPLQILTANGGVAPYTFAITSGALPGGLTFLSPQFSGIPTSAGQFSFTITVTDASGKTVSSFDSITIDPAAAALIISQSLVPFSLTVGSNNVPSPASVTVRSSVVQQLLNYSLTVSPQVSWLDVTGGGTTPGSVGIALAPSAVSLGAAGTPYQTTINLSCIAPSACAGSLQTILVSLTVTAPPPQLVATSALLSFALSSNAVAVSQPLGIQNTGGGTLTIGSVTVADNWLSVSGVPATLPAGPAVPVTVTANPTGLSAGYRLSHITINSAAGPVSVPVSLLISGSSIMTLAPAGIQFQSTAGSAPGNPGGSLLVTVAGNSTANWTASALPGSPWLSLDTPSGTASSATPGTVSFSIDSALSSRLAPGTYYATIRIASPDAIDSPLDFGVILNVTPSTTPVKPDLSPAGLVFVTTAAGGSPASRNVQVHASSNVALPYQASASTNSLPAWLSVSPSTGSASSSAPGASTVSVSAAGLAPGVYTGGVSYAFASAAVRTVNVTLVVVPARLSTQPECVPNQLDPAQIGLVDNFQQFVGWPTALAVIALNNCGSPVTDTQLVASFSNGDPPLTLTPVGSSSGMFSGTWTPRSVSPQATVSVNATSPNLRPAFTKVTGQVVAGTAPLLAPDGTVQAFYSQIGGALAPGTIVEIYGSNFAGGIAQTLGEPLTTTLGGTSVLIGGIAAPLFYVSPEQINAQLPFALLPGNLYQVQVNNGGALSTPNSIEVAPHTPGIAALESGQVIAQSYPNYSLVTEAAPAKPGQYVTIYLVGLGATDPPVAAGASSPADGLAHPLIAPTLNLNGNTVPIEFAGLTPGSVGLYQINFQVPADTPDGDLTLIVSQGGVDSNAATLPVKQ